MEPLYFNPLDNTGNFIGNDPLTPTDVPVKTSFYPYFNPSIYQSFTFYSFPVQSFSSTFVNTSSYYRSDTYNDGDTLAITSDGNYSYYTEFFSAGGTIYQSYFSTFETINGIYTLQPITYSIRFGTELQTLYGSLNQLTETTYTYESYFNTGFFSLYTLVYTVLDDTVLGSSAISNYESEAFVFTNTVVSSNQFEDPSSIFAVGSSSFVNIMGSNVYSGLIDSTNSIIIYQNEQVSSYYSESLSYQVNIANLTAALNSVSGNSPDNQGEGTITVTYFSWIWESTSQGWTGSQLTNFPNYLSTATVNTYLSVNYGGTVITNSSVAVTQVQSLITVQNNDLANAQTFMNNAVTTLQSQVSLAGQIIGTLSSIMQSIISNI